MATIFANENAPQEEVSYNLPTVQFDLAQGGEFETDDRRALADAEAHPWLSVIYPAVDEAEYTRPEKSVPYEDDYLSAANSVAFDPDAIRAVEESKRDAAGSRLAVNAGLDQNEPAREGEVATSLAADDRDEATLSQDPADNPYSHEYEADEPVTVEPTDDDRTED